MWIVTRDGTHLVNLAHVGKIRVGQQRGKWEIEALMQQDAKWGPTLGQYDCKEDANKAYERIAKKLAALDLRQEN